MSWFAPWMRGAVVRRDAGRRNVPEKPAASKQSLGAPFTTYLPRFATGAFN